MYHNPKKDPWDVNPFTTCKSISCCEIVHYRITGLSKEELKENVLKFFYELERKYLAKTGYKGLITKKVLISGPVYEADNNGIKEWFEEGDFYCHIPTKLKKERLNDDEAR